MKSSTATSIAPFVATNLSVYRGERDNHSTQASPSDLTIDGLPYRRLDPAYYAWLRSRMEKARQAWQSGKLDGPSFAALRDKFNFIHDEAIRLFGEPALLRAVRSFDPKTYPAPTRCSEEKPSRIPGNGNVERPGQREVTDKQPATASPTPTKKPVPDMDRSFRFPEAEDPALPFSQPVRISALAKVRAIEEQALTAGWTLPELYQNRGRYRFPYGGDYGIACFIDPDQKLGAVTGHSIELICRGGHSLYFRRRGREHLPLPKTHSNQEAVGS
jgi:hypothetical protein